MLSAVRLQVIMEALQNVELPPFCGSTLRGAFLQALKEESCLSRTSCGEFCALPTSCVYGALCETPAPETAPKRVKSSRFAPHPYVLTPPKGGLYYSGELLTFQLTLFGGAPRKLPTVLKALERMASTGIGKGRKSLRLFRVSTFPEATPVYKEGTIDLEGLQIKPLTWEPRESPSDQSLLEGQDLLLEMITPLKLQKHGRLLTKIDAGELVYAAADRLYLLSHCHGRPESAPDAAEVAGKARAAQIKVLEDDLRRVSFDRFSGRQNKKHRLDGLLGQIRLGPGFGPFFPLLQAASQVHLGNGTSFGLGAIALQLVPASERTLTKK